MIWDILGVATLAIWIYLLVARGRFWRSAERDLDAPPPPDGRWPAIVAVIPARDEALGVGATIASLCRQDYPGDLRALVGSFGPVLKRYAFGEDDRPLSLGDEIKSISNEETFLHDTEDRKILRRCLREQATDLSERMKRRRLGAYTVQVKLRYGDFTTLTRQISVEESITEANDIYRLACFLLGREKLVSRPLRLLGLGVSNLREPSGQQLAFL